jgi:D-glycero-alpha-D-manno-heptose 1-phosphate guanylyltransferase
MSRIKEAIILAGGLGTRLRSAVPDLPKCLAPVAGRPFIGYEVSLEDEPLGTGGAIRQACGLGKEKTVLILNGDTFFRIGLEPLSVFHEDRRADCSLCLKPMENFDRFGVVELDADGRVTRFREKQHYTSGLINGGVYALDREAFLRGQWPPVFSFEKDYLEKVVGERLFGLVQDNYFIDIGIPEDYRRVQEEFKKSL